MSESEPGNPAEPPLQTVAHFIEAIDHEKKMADATMEWLKTVQILAFAAVVVALLVFVYFSGTEGFCGSSPMRWNLRGGWNRRAIDANWNPYRCTPYRTSVPVPVVDYDQPVGSYSAYGPCVTGPCRPQASPQYPFVPARPVPAYGDAWGDYAPPHYFAPRV
jgi:hypothetical protein